jgi:uncharacterized protein (TIGR00730 family)
VNNLTRLRPSRRERYRMTVFGSARTQPGHWVYEEVKQMCSALSAMNCDIITGGGPGLMQAANEGARTAEASPGVRSLGIRVHLPFEQRVNPFVEQAFEHGTFFTRLHHFVLTSDAYIVAPGGLGTVLESMMIWQLLQVRHLHDTPLIFAGPMWRGLVEWARASCLASVSTRDSRDNLRHWKFSIFLYCHRCHRFEREIKKTLYVTRLFLPWGEERARVRKRKITFNRAAKSCDM